MSRTRRSTGEIQVLSTNSDQFVDETKTWLRVRRSFFDIRPLSGRELILAQQTNALTTHRIETEYVDDVLPEMRVVSGGKAFNILSVINANGANRSLELMCVERVGAVVEVTDEAENDAPDDEDD